MSEKIDQNQAKVSELEAKAKKEEKAKELSGELEKHHETFFGAVDNAQESLTKGESQLQEPQNKQVLKTFGEDIQGYLENVAVTGESLYQSQLKGGPSTGKEKIAAEAGKMNERVGEIEKGLPVLKACEYATSQETEASKTYIDWAKNILNEGKLGEEKLTPAKKRELVTGAADKAVEMLAAAKKEMKQAGSAPDILSDYYRATMDTVNTALEEAGKLKLFYETKDFTDQEEYAKYFVMNEQTGEVKKTKEFDALPIEKQNELLIQLHGLRKKVADEIEEKCALDKEEKLYFEGKKLMVSGDLTFAKRDFLAFIDHFSAKKEKSHEEETRIKECKEYLKQIGLLEVSTARQRLALMKKSIDARFASVTNPGQLESGVSYAEAKISMEQMATVLEMTEKRIQSGESMTIEEVDKKLRELDVDKIDPNYEEEKFALKAWQNNFEFNGKTHGIFNELVTQELINQETDQKKKGQLILNLAKNAYANGFPDLARQYYDQYFLPEIQKKSKEISKSDFTQDLLGKTDFQKQLNSRMASLEPELRESLSKEWNHKYFPDGVTEARQKELEDQGISFDSELKKAMDTEKEKIQGSMIDEEYMKVVKTEVHKDFKAYTKAYSNVESGGPKADRAGAWNDVYGNTFHNLDSFDTHWYEVWKFSDEEWNKFKTMAIVDIGTLMVSGGMATVAAEGLVGVAVMERLAVAGVSKVVVNEALKKGSVYFAMLVVKELGWKEAVKMGLGHFIVESGVFHTVHSALQSGVYGTSEAFTDPLAFFESWGAGALQFGAVKAAHLGFSFKPSSESFLGKLADKFMASTGSIGVQNLTGLALMAMSGEEITEEKIAKMQQNNIIFEVGVGAMHEVVKGFRGEQGSSVEPRKESERKEQQEQIKEQGKTGKSWIEIEKYLGTEMPKTKNKEQLRLITERVPEMSPREIALAMNSSPEIFSTPEFLKLSPDVMRARLEAEIAEKQGKLQEFLASINTEVERLFTEQKANEAERLTETFSEAKIEARVQYESERWAKENNGKEMSLEGKEEIRARIKGEGIRQMMKFEQEVGRKAKEVLEDLKFLELERQEALFQHFRKINPDIKMVDAENGIFHLQGTEIYGSIFSIIDTNGHINDLRPIAEFVQSGAIPGVDSRVVMSGSGAQKETNPYPTDIDMAEFLHLNGATTKEEAGELMARVVRDTYARSRGLNNIEFVEMKLGQYPEGVVPSYKPKNSHSKEMVNRNAKGEGVKWLPKDIEKGYKDVPLMEKADIAALRAQGYEVVPDGKGGNTLRISLEKAGEDPGFYKIDWRGFDHDGKITEITKVSYVEAPNAPDFRGTTSRSAAVREVHLEDPSGMLGDIMRKATNPTVTRSTRDFLIGSAINFGLGEGNYLKAAKKLYGVAKITGDVALMSNLSGILQSPYGKLHQVQDRMSMIAQALTAEGGTGLDKGRLIENIKATRETLEEINNIDLPEFAEAKQKALERLNLVEKQLTERLSQPGKLSDTEIAKGLLEDVQSPLSKISRLGSRKLFEENPKIMRYLLEKSPGNFFQMADTGTMNLLYTRPEYRADLLRMVSEFPEAFKAKMETLPPEFFQKLLDDPTIPETTKTNIRRIQQEYIDSPILIDLRDGKPARVFVGAGVDMSSEIASLQKQIQKLDPNLVPHSEALLHVTVGHIGIPDEVYSELLSASGKPIDRASFDRAFSQLLAESDGALPVGQNIRIAKISQFGKQIVAEIERTPELEAAHKKVYAGALQMLRTLGIENPAAVLRKTKSIARLDTDGYKPHVTLAEWKKINREDAPDISGNLPGIIFSPSASVNIKPSKVVNTHKKGEGKH